MNKNLLVVIALIVLVVISAVQAVQLNTLKEKASEVEMGTAKTTSSVASSGASVPSNIQDLPGMVGGC